MILWASQFNVYYLFWRISSITVVFGVTTPHRRHRTLRLRVWNSSLVSRRCLARKTCSARRDPELPERWARRVGKGREVCLVFPCLALWWYFRDPESLRRHPRHSFRFSHLLFVLKHHPLPTPLTRQLHLRNNSNLDNFPQSVIMPFRIASGLFHNFLSHRGQNGSDKLLCHVIFMV